MLLWTGNSAPPAVMVASGKRWHNGVPPHRQLRSLKGGLRSSCVAGSHQTRCTESSTSSSRSPAFEFAFRQLAKLQFTSHMMLEGQSLQIQAMDSPSDCSCFSIAGHASYTEPCIKDSTPGAVLRRCPRLYMVY